MGCLNSVRGFVGKYVSVEPVLFIYMAAIFMEMSVVQDMMLIKLCLQQTAVTDYHQCHNRSDEEHNKLTTELSSWMGYYNLTMFFFSCIISCYVGSWADRYNRKMVLLLPTVGSVIAVGTLLMNALILDLHVAWVLVSGAISGATGGTIAVVATSFGYIVNIASPETRTMRIVILEACLYIGGTLGMIIGGLVHKKVFAIPDLPISSYSVIFFIELGLLALVIAYIIFRVEEIQRPYESTNLNQSLFYELFNLNHFKEAVSTTFKPRGGNYRMYILLLLLASLLINYTLAVQISLNFIFVSSDMLKWSQPEYSYFTAFSFAMSGLSLLIFLPVFFRWLSLQDATVAIMGTASKMAGLILLGLSTTTTMVYISAVLALFSEFSIPAIRSMLSKLVDENEKGKIFALMQLLQSVSFLTGSQIFNPLYKATQHVFKGLSYELVAGLEVIAIFILLYIHFRRRQSENYQHMVIQEESSET